MSKIEIAEKNYLAKLNHRGMHVTLTTEYLGITELTGHHCNRCTGNFDKKPNWVNNKTVTCPICHNTGQIIPDHRESMSYRASDKDLAAAQKIPTVLEKPNPVLKKKKFIGGISLYLDPNGITEVRQAGEEVKISFFKYG